MRVALVDYNAPDSQSLFAQSMRETGFAVLADPPITARLIYRIYDEWQDFFSTDDKYAYTTSESDQGGYFPPPPPSVTAPGGLVRDRKEYFHVYSGGRYPSDISDAALRYLKEAKTLSATLLQWLEANTPAELLQTSVPLSRTIEGSPGTVLRIQHYLPLSGTAGPLRALTHQDTNLITLLPAPREPGLQISDISGVWHDIASDPRSMIVNGGEMLHLATSNYYPATPHRVVNPSGGQPRGSRMSLPLFVHPAPDIVLAPGHTASSFLQERIAVGRAKGWYVVPGGGPKQ